MEEHKPVIEILNYRITSIKLVGYHEIKEIEMADIEDGLIKASASVSESFNKARLKVGTTIKDVNNLRTIEVEITGSFKINEKDNDKAQEYLRTNGTAILMPYLRAIVSILTSLDNENAIILPTINTNNFKDTSE